MEKETFELIKRKHGGYASWAIWAEPGPRPKSNTGDLSVLDPDRNPSLLDVLRNDVVMMGLNLSRGFPVPFGNFHDSSPKGQDYKIRYAFAATPYWGAYMTDLIKGLVMLKSGDVIRYCASNPTLIEESIQLLLQEFDDLGCGKPQVLTFGAVAHRLAVKYVPSSRYSSLIRLRHYSDYVSQETYLNRPGNPGGSFP
jgi:hypothetical protein